MTSFSTKRNNQFISFAEKSKEPASLGEDKISFYNKNDQDGYAIGLTNGGTFENDIWCIVLCDGGHIRHYRSDQIRMHHNATLDLTKHNEKGNK
jgi:hypothetical protein